MPKLASKPEGNGWQSGHVALEFVEATTVQLESAVDYFISLESPGDWVLEDIVASIRKIADDLEAK